MTYTDMFASMLVSLKSLFMLRTVQMFLSGPPETKIYQQRKFLNLFFGASQNCKKSCWMTKCDNIVKHFPRVAKNMFYFWFYLVAFEKWLIFLKKWFFFTKYWKWCLLTKCHKTHFLRLLENYFKMPKIVWLELCFFIDLCHYWLEKFYSWKKETYFSTLFPPSFP